MSKRTIDDAGLEIEDPRIEEAIVFKKVRKNSKVPVEVAEVKEDAESKAAKKERKRLKKLKKVAKVAGVDLKTAEVLVQNGEEEPHVEFKESLVEVIGAQEAPTESIVEPPSKKKSKKIKLAEKTTEDKTETVGGETSAPDEASKPEQTEEEKKAAKKARKLEKKLAKTGKGKEDNANGAEKSAAETVSSSVGEEKNSASTEPTKGSSDSYTEDADLTALPQADIDKFLTDNFITITDPKSTQFRPITKFSYLPITDSSQLAPFKDFKAPTPIQAAAWPFLLAGRDVIGVAETGSGKTMAFAVPCVRAISNLPKNQRNKGARAVVVSPTRELAMQSFEQIQKLAKVSGLQAVCVYGGVAKDQQRKDLKTADIVIATPGRLNDLINEGYADLSKAKYVVLDEADRMLDKGFEEEIRKIINTTPAIGKRQTLMFTATWPESVRTLAATFMTTPVKIAIGDNPTGDLRANIRITQRVEVVDPRNKEWRLIELLKQHTIGAKSNDRILVFCLYKKEATRVEAFVRQKGFRVGGIHGDLSQEQRTRSLDAFKKGTTPILVATDVAARGLDIPDVQLVLNCTFPLTCEDYIHRIGRTGRAGKDGLAITLFTEHDKGLSGGLINILKAANQPVPDELLKFGTTVKKKEHDAYGAFARDVDMTKTAKKIRFD